ncbi:MAG: type II toxin-antitoxin system HicB family antitoxin [Thermomicrobiales bacterium]
MNRHAQSDLDPETQMTQEDYEAAKPYAVVIEWDERDGIFLATVPDIRGCRTHGATRAEAAANVEEAIAATLATFTDSGVPLPKPRFTALDDAISARATLRSA